MAADSQSPPAANRSGPPPSPFFRPHTPRPRQIVEAVTPRGTRHRRDEGPDEESKTDSLGTAFNFVNQIVGCGVVGVPFAIRESGLVAGVILICVSAYLTRKSLHLLIDTARHVDASTYEALCEAGFGRGGFLSVTAAMFVLAFGSMVSYLMVVRDTLPELVGLSGSDFWPKRVLMVAASAVTMFPLSTQRDMADLAKTSTVSVIFDIILVGIVAYFSPLWGNDFDDSNVHDMTVRWRDDISYIKWDTIFVGLGVLSFAFVCQHSGFLIAGSLRNPTQSRLRRVTLSALSLCATLAAVIGITGYLGFGTDTEGNVLNCFPESYLPANVARALLSCTMIFVYPMESFVARHALVVVLFSGRPAKEGDDHAVLARPARRIGLTLVLYLLALVPAVAFEDLGNVLALTGALGGSAMSYIGPGLCYLGVYGEEFLELVEERWGRSWVAPWIEEEDTAETSSVYRPFSKILAWYTLLMPLWCTVAARGKRCLAAWHANRDVDSPYPSRLGKVVHKKGTQIRACSNGAESRHLLPPRSKIMHWQRKEEEDDDEGDFKPVRRTESFPAVFSEASCDEGVQLVGPASYGSRAVDVVADTATSALSPANDISKGGTGDNEESCYMDGGYPTGGDFLVAIGYFVFGVVAATAGVLSVFL